MQWADPSMFRVFNEIARNLISARGDDLWESTRVLALLNVAIFDSYVAVFEAKYHYQFWRPTMAIRGAALTATTRPPLTQTGYRCAPRRPSRNIHQATQVPAGALRSYWRAHSAVTHRSLRPAPCCPDKLALSATLTKHLGNVLRVECFLGPTSVSQMKMLGISAST
jgi:hypothetical protein